MVFSSTYLFADTTIVKRLLLAVEPIEESSDNINNADSAEQLL